MSSIPYNSKAYLDAKVSMSDHGMVDAGRQVQSPASAAKRKRRKDPNPNRRGKAINVKTKKKK